MQKRYFEQKRSIIGINVTPIIDVALVLVIILMITTPIMTISNLPVDLPKAHTHGGAQGERLNVTVNADGQVAIDRETIAREDLAGFLGNRLDGDKADDLMVVIRADGAVSHKMIRSVLRDAREAGARRLAIATSRAAGHDDREPTWMR